MRSWAAVRSKSFLAASILVSLAISCGSEAGGEQTVARAGPSGDSSEPARRAPDFALKDLAGQLVRLSDFDGQVRLVDFWATWCAPCREEIPVFNELQRKYGEQGFKLLAIAMDERPDRVVPPFVEEYRIGYSVLLGTDDVAEAYGPILGYPTKFLVDREGRIAASFIGPVPKRVLETRIRSLLGGARAS